MIGYDSYVVETGTMDQIGYGAYIVETAATDWDGSAELAAMANLTCNATILGSFQPAWAAAISANRLIV